MGIIYRAISPSEKVYIGKTVKTLQKRKCSHKHNAYNEKSSAFDCKFYRAVRKYGLENFKWKIILNNIPDERLDIEEMLAIYLYDTYYGGYNSTLGGDGGSLGHEVSMETRKKIGLANSAALKGRKQPVEVVAYRTKRLRELNSGSNNHMYGKFGEFSPIANKNITFDLICQFARKSGFKRNQTAKLLGCATQTLRNRILKRGFSSWFDFCDYVRKRN
jgi:group I intron endonuclease